ncbi:tail-anchored protein insertion receptor, partial [Tremellales sp. Uapishka_1]
MNLPLLIFLYVLLVQTISWVGKTALQDVVYSIYASIFLSSVKSSQTKLRRNVLADKAELAKTSSQDEFAKWAKLRRKLDKGLADLEKLNTTLTSSKTSFSTKFNTLMWISTTGARMVLVWWFRKSPVFWLPKQWVPRPVAYLLSFPSAPRGSVSSGVWATVCARVLASGEEIVKELFGAAVPVQIPTAPIPAQKQSAKIEAIELEHEKLD